MLIALLILAGLALVVGFICAIRVASEEDDRMIK